MEALFRHHVFVDLETTGLDPSVDEVIELGALFVHEGKVVERMDRLFAPSSPLPLTIQRITGLTDEDLKGRERFTTYRLRLREDLKGWTVVAHNASFEQGFLYDLLQEIEAPVLDSCELLHYLYPELESHSLEALVAWAGVSDHAAHRALKDCEDTFAVLRVALDRCAHDGRSDDLRELLSILRPESPLPARAEAPSSALLELLQGLFDECKRFPAPLALTADSDFLPTPKERSRAAPRAPAPPSGEIPPVPPEEVDRLLGPSGALERAVPGFHSRPQQLSIAHEVARTLSDGGTLAMEAGTGSGKSLAYLAPAALFALRSGRKVAVAPHTKALQDQLVEKDLPKLHRAMEGAFQYTLLKGQQNYLCRRRALEVTQVEPAMGHPQRAPRAYLRALLRRSRDGDIDRASHWFRERFPALAGLLIAARSESATTLAGACPHFRRCFYHSAVHQAHQADLLVINQSLALSWSSRLPEVHELILDEAHEVEDAATAALGGELGDGTLAILAERLTGRGGRPGVARALALSPGAARDRARARGLAEEIRGGSRALLDAGAAVAPLAAAFVREAPGTADGGEAFTSERRIDAVARETQAFAALAEALGAVHAELAALQRTVGVSIRESFPDLGKEDPVLEREIAGALAELGEAALLLQEVLQDPHDSRCYAVASRPGEKGFLLSAYPVDVRTPFREELAAEKRALVLSSATLFTGGGRPWVLDRLGLGAGASDPKPSPVRQLRAPSPFQLDRQALVVLVTDAPPVQEDVFLDWSAGRIAGLARFMGGRVLGLFASTRRLDEVHGRVQAALEPLGIEVLAQSRGHARSLAARQEQDAGSVLLGTKSFWQGVDIPGLGVAVVFIDKLPIEPNARPLVSAREERFGDGPFAGFAHYRLPRALLQLRQGVGRLIRSTTDRGVVIVADPGHPSYRDQVRAALEGYRVEELPWAVARRRIHDALISMGLVRQAPRPRREPPAYAVRPE
jgi:ATP-dependent DNA helicase DinG